MKLYAPSVNRLIIQTTATFDLGQFSNLDSLVLCHRNPDHFAQIQYKITPYLTHLSFLLGCEFMVPNKLVQYVFSNEFPSLRYVNLGCINKSSYGLWTKSPSLQSVSILSCKPMIIPFILVACPNLQHLRVHISRNDNHINNTDHLPPLLNHPLRRFILWSDYNLNQLTFADINYLLSYTPNVEYFYLQTVYLMPFIDLAKTLVNQLNYLSRFSCYIKEKLNHDDRVGNLTDFHQIHPCFNQIRCQEENDEFRIFTTD